MTTRHRNNSTAVPTQTIPYSVNLCFIIRDFRVAVEGALFCAAVFIKVMSYFCSLDTRRLRVTFKCKKCNDFSCEHGETMNKLTSELVAIHAHICGDGNMYIKTTRRSPSSRRTGRTLTPYKRYVVQYTNTRPELIAYVKKCCLILYPDAYIHINAKKYRLDIRRKALFDSLLALGYQNGTVWTIPNSIVYNTRFRRIWLRAFFDDEGTVTDHGIIGHNTNKHAIILIEKMLKLENMKTSITVVKPSESTYKPCYRIRIWKRSLLAFRKIGFNHEIKQQKYLHILTCTSRESNPDPRLGRPLSYH